MLPSYENAERLLWVLLLWLGEIGHGSENYKGPNKKEIAEFTGLKAWRMGKNIRKLILSKVPPDLDVVREAYAQDKRIEKKAREERLRKKAEEEKKRKIAEQREKEWKEEPDIKELKISEIQSAWYKRISRDDGSHFYEALIGTGYWGTNLYRYGFSATEEGARELLDDMWQRTSIKTCGYSIEQAAQMTKEQAIISNN